MKNTFDYSKLAKYYDEIYSNKDYDRESEFVKQVLNKYNCKRILDVGCGTGNHLVRLVEYGFKCVGLDIHEEMLNIA